MFSIGWGEIFILLIAGLVILGPERLPGAISWVTKSLRQVRSFAQDASGQLREQLGPELSELQEPIQQLSKLRGTSPTALISKHLLDGESPDSLLNPLSPTRPSAPKPAAQPSSQAAQPSSQNEERQGPPAFDPDAT
ncbi:Sec-independent protein translocase protein TatB [Segniliparus rugosus]|uniref:Sec-independent protein translocase protein TatB n=1 Tax=Segniliparus rugosus (strain ATCC BAA-974 / DSM 45345 / CCUG 50838 / CIP 108380 / JCM 13579 / CDC 945) TaxID=679197 RepID=E5XS04_SEGRC|nr:Sec-independent protein translocase protein TatB [Segniliparus rugosus]EFV12789.1 twin arginine-targeting protein translocase TatB [Segniliparus rugosus ATCC BAA-974]